MFGKRVWFLRFLIWQLYYGKLCCKYPIYCLIDLWSRSHAAEFVTHLENVQRVQDVSELASYVRENLNKAWPFKEITVFITLSAVKYKNRQIFKPC